MDVKIKTVDYQIFTHYVLVCYGEMNANEIVCSL